ncbi:MAG: hypothetical protein KDB03_01060 [Planctomycetales bacterium]|nr:hypothetical protein [Planctomycetales bacterium]
MNRILSTLVLFSMVLIASQQCQAQSSNWATLKMKFKWTGEQPKLENIDGSRDPFCAKFNIPDERLLVGADGGVKNVVLYMDSRRSKAKDIHPSLQQPRKEPVELDNKGCVFIPRVVPVRAGETIRVKNSDLTGHNANFNFFANNPVNFLVPAGQFKDLKLEKEEPAPIPVECNVHPWMKAYVIATEHPYVGVSDESGAMVIENLPAGEVSFRFWHEHGPFNDEIKVNGKPAKLSRGRYEITLTPGLNDLGEVEFSLK